MTSMWKGNRLDTLDACVSRDGCFAGLLLLLTHAYVSTQAALSVWCQMTVHRSFSGLRIFCKESQVYGGKNNKIRNNNKNIPYL